MATQHCTWPLVIHCQEMQPWCYCCSGRGRGGVQSTWQRSDERGGSCEPHDQTYPTMAVQQAVYGTCWVMTKPVAPQHH
jgi:hypothetical protein